MTLAEFFANGGELPTAAQYPFMTAEVFSRVTNIMRRQFGELVTARADITETELDITASFDRRFQEYNTIYQMNIAPIIMTLNEKSKETHTTDEVTANLTTETATLDRTDTTNATTDASSTGSSTNDIDNTDTTITNKNAFNGTEPKLYDKSETKTVGSNINASTDASESVSAGTTVSDEDTMRTTDSDATKKVTTTLDREVTNNMPSEILKGWYESVSYNLAERIAVKTVNDICISVW